jgi:hypothetical protein
MSFQPSAFSLLFVEHEGDSSHFQERALIAES